MSTLQLKQPIQFLLEQLKNKDNKSRFNSICQLPVKYQEYNVNYFAPITQSRLCIFEELSKLEKEHIIRTCLSRTKETEDDDGDAIISVFEGDSASSSGRGIDRYDKISDLLGEEFDLLIRHSYSLDEAIDFLGERMIDLVPEYEEFCKTDLK